MHTKIKNWVIANPDLTFAILLAMSVYSFFGVTEDLFPTHRTAYAIMERFAVLGLVGLALTLCIIAGEIDLSIGSNAALAAVITVRFTDSLGAPTGLFHRLSAGSCDSFDGRHPNAITWRRTFCS
jgi:ribose transport system permease protein